MSPPTGPTHPAGRPHRHYGWVAATTALMVVGVGVSAVSAASVGRDNHEDSMQVFQRESGHVAQGLQTAIERQDDLVFDAGGLLSGPSLSQTEFLRWAETARVLERHPGMLGLATLDLVEDADLPAFAARATADPAGTLEADGSFAVIPAGTRPFYCLVVTTLASVPEQPSAGLDYCAESSGRATMLASRDTGRGVYLPYPLNGETWLVVQTPIYRSPVAPTRVIARREAFAGWVGTLVDPQSVLDQALEDDPQMSAEMRYQVDGTDVTFSSGPPPAGATSATIALDNGWTVRVFGHVDPGGATRGDALLLLLSCTTLSILLGLLLFVLGTGRQRARRQLELRTSQLQHRTLHDALTGLPNRALVMDRMEQMLVRDRRHGTRGAAIFLDLDDFKNVNDTLGHGAGDRLLIAVGDRLSGALREGDTIGRMGGDEFVVVVDGASLDVAPELVAQRLLDVMRQPFDINDDILPLTVNISIGVATGDRANADDLLRDADMALYQAKEAGKHQYRVFDPEIRTTLRHRTDLEFELRSALVGGQFRLVYQPIYDLTDLSIVGVEALLRWDHPTRGVVEPDEFLPILERTGQIREVGRWVLREACQQMAAWHARGDTLDVSVNVSARQLDDDDIIADVGDALSASGLHASSLIIEVTETALMDNVQATAERLHAIKALGARIAVDDFGTGYSSLAYLQQFPADSLKIDKSFISAITSSPESRALVATLVQLGKDLGLSTLAEGVETTEEMDLLRQAHVNQAQGFLMARPLDAETLEIRLLDLTRETAPPSDLDSSDSPPAHVPG